MTTTARRRGLASMVALGLIGAYQRWISPHKGYRCAHAVLYGGTGCSGFAKAAIRDRGLWGAWQPIRQRFRDCRAAMTVLSTQDGARRRPKSTDPKFCRWSDAAMCGAEGCCTVTGEATKVKAGMCGALGSLGALGCCGN